MKAPEASPRGLLLSRLRVILEYSGVILEYSGVILGLDPRITLSAYWLHSSQFTVARADARAKPEHDGKRPKIAQ
jgi:hypothetical protein